MVSKDIVIIDYGAGNLRSVKNSLVKIGYQPRITNKPEDVLNADVVFFPGVGAAPDAMDSLKEAGLDNAVKQVIDHGKPLFAICVGMQVLLSATEEGGLYNCLDIIPGTVRKLPPGLKVPHMGWNQIEQKMKHPIFEGIPDQTNFYFVHSYYPDPGDGSVVAGITEYGKQFCSILVKDNLVATQFHPEKSAEHGLKMYANFLSMAGIER